MITVNLQQTTSKKILVVENELKWIEVIQKILVPPDFDVQIATSYEGAKVKLRATSEAFDLIIVNLCLVNQNDYEGVLLLEDLVDHHIPCIVLTGSATPTRGLYERFNVHEVFFKGPHFNRAELREVIRQVIESRDQVQPSSGVSESVEHVPLSQPRHITWLHISDLHLHPPDYGADIVLKNLLRDVEEQMSSQSLEPDFIVVTGDIAHTGKGRQYERAVGFLEELRLLTGLGKSRLFVVPGNHDTDWALIDDAFAAVCSKVLTSKDAVDETLGKPGEFRRILKKFRHYKRFVNTYLTNPAGNPLRPCDHNHLYFTETMTLANIPVSVLGLNSAWMSAYKWKPRKMKKDADDRHNLLLGRRQLRDALAEVETRVKKDEPHLVIAIMHHPTEWLKDGIDRQEVEALLEERCNFVLRGHLHDNKVVRFQTPGGEAVTITAGASFKTRGGKLDYNGYNFVRLDLDKGEGTIYLRAYSQKYSEFWTDDVFSYPKTDGGRVVFPLPDFEVTNLDNSRRPK